MKTNFTRFIFALFLLPAGLSAQTQSQSHHWSIKSDMLSPLRGNRAISFLLDYTSKSGKTHGFGVDWIYGYGNNSSVRYPSIPTFNYKGPSGALHYSLTKPLKEESRWYYGGHSLVGVYNFRYSRFVCFETQYTSTFLEPSYCKCLSWVKDEVDYHTLQLSGAAILGVQWQIGKLLLGIESKVGVYSILQATQKAVLTDKIDCPNISFNGSPEHKPHFEGFGPPEMFDRLWTHQTEAFGKPKFNGFIQFSLFFGYKF